MLLYLSKLFLQSVYSHSNKKKSDTHTAKASETCSFQLKLHQQNRKKWCFWPQWEFTETVRWSHRLDQHVTLLPVTLTRLYLAVLHWNLRYCSHRYKIQPNNHLWKFDLVGSFTCFKWNYFAVLKSLNVHSYCLDGIGQPWACLKLTAPSDRFSLTLMGLTRSRYNTMGILLLSRTREH